MANKETSTRLPSFRKPPVVEVALGVQFDELLELTTAKVGLLWNKFRKDFPQTQDHPPLGPVIDAFGDDGRIKLRLEPLNRPPRVWFLNNTDDQVIQVQQDRFVVNWRKREGQEYPRFPSVRKLFAESLDQFLDFLRQEKIGSFVPNQCEVTYVNQILPDQGWRGSEFEKVISPWRGSFTDKFLASPQVMRLQNAFTISAEDEVPQGRLHTDLQTVKTEEGQSGIALNMTAMGPPATQDKQGVLAFLDLGHEWVVKGFASYTSSGMHEIWERYE